MQGPSNKIKPVGGAYVVIFLGLAGALGLVTWAYLRQAAPAVGTMPSATAQALLALLGALGLAGLFIALLAQTQRSQWFRRESEIEAEFHRLFNQVGDAVIVRSLQDQFLLANALACQRYGYTPDEWPRLRTQDLLLPEELPRLEAAMQQLARDGQAVFETVHRHKDGTPLPVEVNTRRTTFQGQPAVVCVIRDIRARRQAEAELEKQRLLLLTLINALPDLIYVKDSAHRFLLANASTARHMGVATPDALRGKTAGEVRGADGADGGLAAERLLLTTGQAQLACEEPGRAPDGTEIWLSSTKVPLRDRAGQVVGIIGIGHDITAIKQLTEKLQAALARSLGLEQALNRSPAIVLLHRGGPDSPLEYVSDNIRRWGYRAEDVTGRAARPWIHPEDRARVAGEIRRLMASQAVEFRLSYRILTHAGEVRWIEDHMRVAGDSAGAGPQAQSLLLDVTAHRQLSEQLQHAQKMETIGRLAGGIAHDFNNLLQVILGFTELLAADLAADDRQLHDVHEIQAAARRARDLTSRLLAFSRKQMILPTVTDLNALIDGTREMLTRVLGEDVAVQTELAADLWPARMDQNQMQQILLNLAINARDALPQGGRVTLSTRNVTFQEEDVLLHPDMRPGPFICCALSDNGTGMSPGVLAHVFEPFFTTKPAGQGSGLGLAMAYGIVKQHEGWIHVYSQASRGTTFKIYLPATPRAAPVAAAEPADAADAAALAGLRVLFLEDEDGVRNLVCRILRQRGCTVFPARLVAEAGALWRQEGGRFDIILSDVVLPDGNGLDFVEHCTATGARPFIVLSSGYTDERARWPLITERGYQFLQKPYAARELIRAFNMRSSRS